jgi:hypothetical protein
MKIKYQLGLLIASSVFAVSCQNTEHKTDEHATHTDEHATHTEAAHTETEDEHALTLDNGNHWQANPETTQGVNNMIQIMAGFSATEHSEDYQALTDTLINEFQMIFQKCTMKGEAHNQLHNFLIPIKGEFEHLNSTDLEKNKLAYANLQKHLNIYKDYFE